MLLLLSSHLRIFMTDLQDWNMAPCPEHSQQLKTVQGCSILIRY